MNLLRMIAVAITIAISTPTTHAHNTMIMPGDGAIMTKLESEEALKLEGTTLRLSYGFSRYQPLMFCGYLGYEKIDIQKMSDKQWNALQTATKKCKLAREKLYPVIQKDLEAERNRAVFGLDNDQDGPNATATAQAEIQRLGEAIRSLEDEDIYIQIFDRNTQFCNRHKGKEAYQTIRPGLRYNETIFSREKSYRHRATYGLHLSAAVLGYEWVSCSGVTPINLTNKEPFDGAEDDDSPSAKADASSICFVVLAGPDPKPYAEAQNHLGYYVVRPDGSIEAYALNGAKLPEKDLAEYPMRLPDNSR